MMVLRSFGSHNLIPYSKRTGVQPVLTLGGLGLAEIS